MSETKKIIMDGDWSSDEMQLASVLLAHPEKFEVLGATAVFGNRGHDQMFENGRDILHFLQRDDIKCYPGATAPSDKDTQREVDGAFGDNGLGGVELPASPAPRETKNAVDYILHTLKNNPIGSVTITASGPLTNIAQAIAKDPIAMKRAKEIVIMGGCIEDIPAKDVPTRRGNITHHAEFNFNQAAADAEAVMSSGLHITLLPMNCTHQLTLTPQREKELATALLSRHVERRAVLGMMKAPAHLDRAKFDSDPVMHDVHCALYLLHPGRYHTQRSDVFVDTEDHPELKEKNHYGATSARWNGTSYTFVASSIDGPDVLFKEYTDSLVKNLAPKAKSAEKTNATKPNILVVGSSVMDQVVTVARHNKPGETVPATDPVYGFGGKGANQAVAASICGANVSMVSCVGDDDNGKKTITNFASRGIDTSSVHVSPTRATGLAPITVSRETGDNEIKVCFGANEEISPKMVDEALAKGPKPKLIVMQCEMPLETIYHTVARAKELGIPSLLNVAPVPEDPKLDLSKLEGLDYLVMNENEIGEVTGEKIAPQEGDSPEIVEEKKQHLIENATRLAKDLLEHHGMKNVMVTLGGQGAVLVNKREVLKQEVFKVNVKDTTGAGDAQLGSFASFLAQGDTPKAALEKASLFSGLSTERSGTQSSYVTAEEFAQAMVDHKVGAGLGR